MGHADLVATAVVVVAHTVEVTVWTTGVGGSEAVDGGGAGQLAQPSDRSQIGVHLGSPTSFFE